MTADPALKPLDRPVLTYPFPTIPEPGTTIEVAPGIHWLRSPLPFALDHINLWLLKDGDGWTIVDTGFGRGDETRALWLRVLDATLAGRPISRVIVTHFHPDHVGLAGWLCERFGVELWISQAEFLTAQVVRSGLAAGDIEKRVEHYRRNGLAGAELEGFRNRGNYYAESVSPLPTRYRRIMLGEDVEIDDKPWRVIVGQGHAPEHVCLFSPDLEVLISGDQVLPKITTNVSVWPDQPDANPLKLYLDGMDFFRPLPEGTLVLPSHGFPFYGLHGRLDYLASHHAERLDAAEAACAAPKSAADIIQVLFHRKLDAQQIGFAMGESLAHLHFLVGAGRLARIVDADGIYRFVRT